jgi:hypothetical protein
LYDGILKGWRKESIKGYAEYKGAERVEVIWMNFEPTVKQIEIVI